MENVGGDDARGAGSHRRLGHDELVVADRHRLGARDPAARRDGGDHNDTADGSEARADDGAGGKADDADGKGADRIDAETYSIGQPTRPNASGKPEAQTGSED